MVHLNWDNNRNNGVIYNEAYEGCKFEGVENRPNLSFVYDSFMYSEVWETTNFKILDGDVMALLDEEIEEIKNVANAWVQPLGQEGNLTVEQLKVSKIWNIKQTFTALVQQIESVDFSEVASWRKQEEEARAYLADNTSPTLIIDSLIVGRGLGETVEEFAQLVTAKADAYTVAYGVLLGKYQRAVKDVAGASTKEEVDSISLIV